MLEIVLAVGLVALGCGLALRPAFVETFWTFGIMAMPYLAMSVLYLLRLRREKRAGAVLKPRSGDLTLGFVIAATLFLCIMLGRSAVAPVGSARESWVISLYSQIGDAKWIQANLPALSLTTALVGALEEIAWRGYMMSEIAKVFGARAAWPMTAVLNAAAYIPTMFMLRSEAAGSNPLAVVAVLGCALVWGFVVARTNRLPVAVLSHALFAWAALIQFPLSRFTY